MSGTVIATFGRMNPPHQGHEKVINTMKYLEERYQGIGCVYTSTSVDYKNPLETTTKIQLLNELYPNVIASTTLFDAALNANQYGSNLLFIVGDDRAEHFQNILDKYNKVLYDYDSINVISAGSRDDERWSGTYMRKLASDKKIEEFLSLCPTVLSTTSCMRSYYMTISGLDKNDL